VEHLPVAIINLSWRLTSVKKLTTDTLTVSLFSGKVCKHCGQWFVMTDFERNKTYADGRAASVTFAPYRFAKDSSASASFAWVRSARFRST